MASEIQDAISRINDYIWGAVYDAGGGSGFTLLIEKMAEAVFPEEFDALPDGDDQLFQEKFDKLEDKLVLAWLKDTMARCEAKEEE